tara:strand:- start:21 stop:335 length:315 start_codon:yes stop_codon:yes gene_type:complete
MKEPTKQELIASSSIWVSAILNFFPGLGSGYLYQRRWKAYWITTLISALWLTIGFYNQLNIDPSDPAPLQSDQTGILGLFFIALFTSVESAWSVNRARENKQSI